MQRIWIAGCAGSGKTTLANFIGRKLDIPVYHRDAISWDENGDERTDDEQITMLINITQNDKWIFEGARFTSSKVDGRLDRCDTIIHISLNRFLCAYRGMKRSYLQAKRFDILEKDKQPFRYHNIKGVLFDYPKKRKQREGVFEMARKKGINVLILKNRKAVKKFCKSL